MPLIRTVKTILYVFGLLLSLLVHAESRLEIVTDPWPPYAYEQNGQAVGTDVDTALAVFKQMGIHAEIKLLPWKRCLAMVENKQADAILAASITEERKAFLHFPIEPVSTGVTVFFKRKGEDINTIDLSNTGDLRTGAMLGYKYCQELDESPLIKNAARVSELEQNFNKLLLERLDLIVAVESVGFFKAQAMGISDKIEVVPAARFCEGGNYLAFAKKPGNDELSEKFGQALLQFKQTSAYRRILQKYGQPQ